ncbi:hypothetical protein [Nocardia sp. NPDC003726]
MCATVLLGARAQRDAPPPQAPFERGVLSTAQHPAAVDSHPAGTDASNGILRAVGAGQRVVIDHGDVQTGGTSRVRLRGEMLVDALGAKYIGRNKKQHNAYRRVGTRDSQPISASPLSVIIVAAVDLELRR